MFGFDVWLVFNKALEYFSNTLQRLNNSSPKQQSKKELLPCLEQFDK